MGEIHPQERLTADLGRRGVCLRHQCIYILQIWEVSVLPRERAVLGVGGEERLTSGNRSGSTLTCTLCHMNAARDFWSLQTCSPTGHSADGSQRDMLIVQCALQMLPKARSLTTDFSIFQYQTTVSEWFGTKYQYARTQTETENENSSGYSHQVKVDDLFCKQW